MPRIERTCYTIRVQPYPGIDPVRALRWSLKALKRHGLKAVAIAEAS